MCCTTSAWSSTVCGCPFFDSLFLALFFSVCFFYPLFFYLNPDLNLFLHGDFIGAISHWHSAKMRSLAPWPKTPLSQVTSPSSLTTSTTRRPMKSSSGTNPATRCPRTCLTRNSTTRPSAERSLHSPLVIQEREEPVDRRQAYYSFEESLLPAQS